MTDPVITLRSNATGLLDWRRQVAALYARIRASEDPRAAHRLWQDERNRLLRDHPESPIPAQDRKGFTGVPVASYDPALRFTVTVDTSGPAGQDRGADRHRRQTSRSSGPAWRTCPASVTWTCGGWPATAAASSCPVKDTSAATYGGGRYLLDTVKGADLGGSDGNLVLDFNFAYNPSCAYDPAWACPLAPSGNTVRVPIKRGELYGSTALSFSAP